MKRSKATTMTATKKTIRCARSKIVIGFLKNNDRNRKRPHRTRAGSRGPRTAMRRRLAWPAYRPGPARPFWWCSRSYRATSAAWIVFAPAPWVSIERSWAGFTDKRYLARFARNPCAPGGGAILDFIARVDRRAGARIFTLVFGTHGFNHWAPPSMRAHAHS